jgi:ribosomal protein L4
MEVKVLDINGKETGRKVQLSDSVFAIEPNNHAVYLDVKQYLANQRQGILRDYLVQLRILNQKVELFFQYLFR